MFVKKKKNKLSPPFDPKPFTDESRKGTMVTAKRGFHTITRNVSFFKKISDSGIQNNTLADDDESDDDDDVQMTSSQTSQEKFHQEAAPPRRSQKSIDNPIGLGFEQTDIRTTNIYNIIACLQLKLFQFKISVRNFIL